MKTKPNKNQPLKAKKKTLLDDVVVTTAIVFLGVLLGITLFSIIITLFIL